LRDAAPKLNEEARAKAEEVKKSSAGKTETALLRFAGNWDLLPTEGTLHLRCTLASLPEELNVSSNMLLKTNRSPLHGALSLLKGQRAWKRKTWM
jgi:hypothetical protein